MFQVIKRIGEPPRRSIARVRAARPGRCVRWRPALKRAAIGEAQHPGLRPEPVDRIEVGRRVGRRLSAGQEEDAGHGRRHAPPQDADGLRGDLAHRGLARLLLAGNDHARLQQHVLEHHPVPMQRIEDFVQNGVGRVGAAREGVAAVHQHLGLDDGHDAFFLADRRVAGQRIRVRLDREPARQRVGDVVDRAPLREARALVLVGAEALREPIEPLGDLVARRPCERDLAGVDLDAGHDALAHRQLRQRRAIVGALAERLLVQDDAADERAEPGRRQQQAAVRAPVRLGRLHADRLEPLGDRRAAFVGGEDALAGLDQRIDCRVQALAGVHAAFSFDVIGSADPTRRSGCGWPRAAG
jgi:hypothetical protein